jgi:Zn-dependent metalloprotease
VDDAEDADVIVHEYGHAIQADQVPGFGAGGDAGGMGEGFGDYLAGTISA